MRFKLFVTGLILSAPILSFAQEDVIPLEKQATLSTGISYQMWRIQGSEYTVTQVAFPMILYVPLRDRFSLTVTHIPALSQWGRDYKIRGLSDTWVQGTFLSGNEKWMLNLGMGVPTGKTRLNNSEMVLSQSIISQDMFRFRLPIYGQGFCLKAGGAFAYPVMEKLVLGIGGQYLMHTAYHPIQYSYFFRSGNAILEKTADIQYKPGNETTVQAGLDFSPGENTKFMLDGVFTHYDKDILENTKTYGSGAKISFHGGVYYQYNEQFIWGFATYRLKGKHELMRGLNFESADKNLNGPRMETGFVWKIIAFKQGMFCLLYDGRFFGRNENKRAGATIYGGGFSLNYRFSARTELNANVKYLTGKLKDASLSRSVEGMEAGCGFKFGL